MDSRSIAVSPGAGVVRCREKGPHGLFNLSTRRARVWAIAPDSHPLPVGVSAVGRAIMLDVDFVAQTDFRHGWLYRRNPYLDFFAACEFRVTGPIGISVFDFFLYF